MPDPKHKSSFVFLLVVGVVLAVLAFLTLVPIVECEACVGGSTILTDPKVTKEARRILREAREKSDTFHLPEDWSKDCASCSGTAKVPLLRLWGNK